MYTHTLTPSLTATPHYIPSERFPHTQLPTAIPTKAYQFNASERTIYWNQKTTKKAIHVKRISCIHKLVVKYRWVKRWLVQT